MVTFRNLVAVCLLSSAFAAAFETPISVAQARREFKQLLSTMYRGEFNNSWRRVEKVALQPLRDVKITTDDFSFEDSREVNGFIPPKQMKTQRQHYRFRELAPVSVSDDRPNHPKQAFFAGPETKENDPCTRKCGTFYWVERQDAERFARALNRLIEHARSGRSEKDFVAFRKSAFEWLQLRTKPPLAQQADRHRILAEEAVRASRLDSAVQHYDEALEIHPMWPEGWLNAALIYAELKDFEAAAERIRHFIELSPNTAEASAAREKLVVWEQGAKP